MEGQLKYVEFSENQKGILVLSQMEEANAAYNLLELWF